ncbi:MAG: sodium:solute symporter [Phycisphaerales bacterium]|nr:sodium:solute symporter [Phycisphaerales bacterium]
MHWIDLSILAAYFVGVFALAIGLSRRAGRNIDSYFLGDRKMRWWLLGASGMASNIDVAGTLLIVSLIYTFGLQGFLIELRGGIVLTMAFFLAFMGKWTRRSGCMTVADWMTFRFGPGTQGAVARLVAAGFNLVFFVWALAYFLKGTSEFLSVYLPVEWGGSPEGAAILLMLSVMVYTSLAGLHGVVWTDVVQGVLILLLALVVTWKAAVAVDPGTLGDVIDADWLRLLPPARIEPPAGYESFSLLALSIGFYFFKTVIDGFSGAGGYMAQRFFAARDEREAGLISLIWIVLMSVRWPLIMGLVLLGLTIPDRISSPEAVLPIVIQEMMPVGLRGLLLVALLGAAMSTYSSFMNAGSAFFVRDIYQAHLRPQAGQRELVVAGYVATIALVLCGVWLALGADRVNDLWSVLTMGVGAGLIVPNCMRWYWYRMNGYGYAAGAGTAMIVALAIEGRNRVLGAAGLTKFSEWQTFGLLCAAAVLAIIVVSLLTRPVDRVVLANFFRTTRPFGWWNPQRADLPRDEVAGIQRENRRDLLALLLAVPWQLVLFLLPMVALLRQWPLTAGLAAALLLLSIGLYIVWYRPLRALA